MFRHRYRNAAVVLSGMLLAGAVQAQIDDDTQPPLKPIDDVQLLDMVELERMKVEGERLEPMEEISLRLVDWALEVDRSFASEDAWKPRCWFDSPVGTHMKYLYCATNGDLNAIRDEAQGIFLRMAGMGAGVGSGNAPVTRATNVKVHRSQFPVNEQQVKRLLSHMGSRAMNKEAVIKTLEEGEIPENLPYQDELDRFAEALTEVKKLRARFDARMAEASKAEREALLREGDEAMAEAIDEAGLTVERYNEISGLVEEFVTLKAAVRERLASLDG